MAHNRHWMNVCRMIEQMKILIFRKEFALGIETWQKMISKFQNIKKKKIKTPGIFVFLESQIWNIIYSQDELMSPICWMNNSGQWVTS